MELTRKNDCSETRRSSGKEALSWPLPSVWNSKPQFKRPARKCFNKCDSLIEFRRTPKAPHGAWVDVGTLNHHRCKRRRHTNEIRKESLPEVSGDRPVCQCGAVIWCLPVAPHSDLCETCYWELQDKQDMEP